MRTVILVPRRDGNEHRDRIWAWVKARWQRDMPDIPIFEGHHDDGPFNRSLAINRASELAADWDVAIIIDSDVICPEPQVRAGIQKAIDTGAMVMPFERRLEMSEAVSDKMMRTDYTPHPNSAYRVFTDTCSSVVIVTRRLWDKVQGFDPGFVGWGCEDNAFAIACETFAHRSFIKIPGDVVHLYHPGAPEGNNTSPTYQANYRRYIEYVKAHGKEARVLEVRRSPAPRPDTRIPRILHRIVIGEEPPKAAEYWAKFKALHPDWTMMTHTAPLNPSAWPLTAPFWDKAIGIVQVADLLRMEALHRWGGVYVDWDVEPLRPFDPLLGLSAFSAWQQPGTVAFGVIGAPPEHPAIKAAIDEMTKRISNAPMKDPRRFILYCGNAAVTAAWENRGDILLLPPQTFYPYHYSEKARAKENFAETTPWAFAVHHWWASWLDPKTKEAIPIDTSRPTPPLIVDPSVIQKTQFEINRERTRKRGEVILW